MEIETGNGEELIQNTIDRTSDGIEKVMDGSVAFMLAIILVAFGIIKALGSKIKEKKEESEMLKSMEREVDSHLKDLGYTSEGKKIYADEESTCSMIRSRTRTDMIYTRTSSGRESSRHGDMIFRHEDHSPETFETEENDDE